MMEGQKRRRYKTEYKQDVVGMIETKGMRVGEVTKYMNKIY
ncbi:MAG: hypothetical protein Q8N83_14445 [Ignavibacteria bacterium]|nr:hypothetical protein [Ignavibacteria bacterium]